MSADALRARIGRHLEAGGAGSPLTRALASGWAAWSARGVARPLRIPSGVSLIGVGGAVLGGAGKTPVAIALARALAARGEHPALVGHAYRARPGAPRIVAPGDPVSLVGDDALAAARLLGEAAPVVVAPDRQAAIDHAAALGHRVIVVDGLLQGAPARLSAAILVLDARVPWGAGACPPLGDLRAPAASLLAAADLVAALRQTASRAASPDIPSDAVSVASHLAGAVSAAGEAFTLEALADLRLGLLLAIARPGRIAAALALAGIRPAVILALADHAVPSAAVLARAARLGRESRLDGWLTTARCATKLPGRVGAQPILTLDHRVDVTELAERVGRIAGLCPIAGGSC